jgi:hypothetical protein
LATSVYEQEKILISRMRMPHGILTKPMRKNADARERTWAGS